MELEITSPDRAALSALVSSTMKFNPGLDFGISHAVCVAVYTESTQRTNLKLFPPE